MPAAFADLDDLKAIYLQGLNERITPESIPLGDLSKLIGLRQNRLGELVRYPGEAKIPIATLDSIRGLFPLGDYVIIQTSTQLLRARLSEIFPEIPNFTPELFPDNYSPITPVVPLNPEEMSYSRVSYELAAGAAPTNTLAGALSDVPLNTIVNDPNNRVSLAAGGVFTVTAGSYPIGVRVNGWATLFADASGAQRGVMRLINASTFAAVAIGENTCAQGTNAQVPCNIQGRITILAATTFKLQQWTSRANPRGAVNNAGGVGQNEVYAQLEILVEE